MPPKRERCPGQGAAAKTHSIKNGNRGDEIAEIDCRTQPRNDARQTDPLHRSGDVTAVDSNRMEPSHSVGFGSKPQPKRLRLVSWKAVAKGSLRGFASIELPIGLKICDIAIMVSNGNPWAALPGKPVLDADGKHKVGANGKGAYVTVLEWRDRDLSSRFSAAVVALVREKYSEALDDRDAT
jgi:hypothetical protein